MTVILITFQVTESVNFLCNSLYWAYEACMKLKDSCLDDLIEDLTVNGFKQTTLCQGLSLCPANQTVFGNK
jgi:hypothetical protein